jgi:hypothetical protein
MRITGRSFRVPGVSGLDLALQMIGTLVADHDALVVEYAIDTDTGGGTVHLQIPRPVVAPAAWREAVVLAAVPARLRACELMERAQETAADVQRVQRSSRWLLERARSRIAVMRSLRAMLNQEGGARPTYAINAIRGR